MPDLPATAIVKNPDERLYDLAQGSYDEGSTTVAELVAAGAYVNFTHLYDLEHTVLHAAVLTRNLGVVRQLIAAGANVNAQDLKGDTPLHEALRLRSKEITEALLDAGAEPAIKTRLD